MGLPSKKQLHKHKRGTRKALDTLDAMDKVDSKTIDDEGVENLVEKKKSKKYYFLLRSYWYAVE